MAVRAVALDAYATLDGTTWAALALVLTSAGAAVVGGLAAPGPAAGLRGLAWTLVPLALWLTGTLKLAASIVADVGHWAVHLVFSPVVWLGVVVGCASRCSWSPRSCGGGVCSARTRSCRRARSPRQSRQARQRWSPRSRPSSDDIEGMDEIEAILKKHGI